MQGLPVMPALAAIVAVSVVVLVGIVVGRLQGSGTVPFSYRGTLWALLRLLCCSCQAQEVDREDARKNQMSPVSSGGGSSTQTTTRAMCKALESAHDNLRSVMRQSCMRQMKSAEDKFLQAAGGGLPVASQTLLLVLPSGTTFGHTAATLLPVI